MAKARSRDHGIHLTTLHLLFSRPWLSRATQQSRNGSCHQTSPCPHPPSPDYKVREDKNRTGHLRSNWPALQSPNPRIGYRTWSSENGTHSNQARKDKRMPGHIQTTRQKGTWLSLKLIKRSRTSTSPCDHLRRLSVNTIASLQVDKTTIWHFLSLWRMATSARRYTLS